MAYIKSYRNQNYLIPPNITELFSKDHVCYLIEQLADSMSYEEFDLRYEGVGGPAYHPRILIKLLLQASIDGMGSSRRIAKNCQENVVYIYLSEKTSPDFRTISDFKKDNKKLTKNVFKQLSLFALKEGLIDLSHLMVDGTTIKANANNDKNLSKEVIEKIEKYIDRVIEEGIKTDEEEDKLYGDRGMHQLPEEFNNSEKRKKVVKEIVENINNSMKEGDKEKVEQVKQEIQGIKEVMKEQGLKKYSLTDPESRFMLNKKGKTELSYNAQLVTDQNGIIISNEVVQDYDDRHQLIPNIERVEQDFGQLPKGTKISADGLYISEDLTILDNKGFDLYLPTYGMQKETKFSKANFTYDEEKDIYICPKNKILPFFSKTKDKRYEYVLNYKCKDCTTCPHQKACCNNKKYRTILAPPHNKLLNRIKEKMQTKRGKQTYKLRQQTVEPAFGDIKHNKKFTEFLLRGVKKVGIEFNLACTARNLIIINNLLKKKTTKKQENKKVLGFLAKSS